MSVFESTLSKVDTLAAAQRVRLFDIYALGPVLLYASTRKAPLGRWTKRTLFIAGIMTIVYNWKKYRSMDADLKKAIQNV